MLLSSGFPFPLHSVKSCSISFHCSFSLLDQFHAAVDGAAFFGIVRDRRLFRALNFSGQPVGGGSLCHCTRDLTTHYSLPSSMLIEQAVQADLLVAGWNLEQRCILRTQFHILVFLRPALLLVCLLDWEAV